MAITILDLAKHRGVEQQPDGTITGQAFEDVGLPFLGGCQRCGASIAAYNMYPSRTGYVQCSHCIDEEIGFTTCEEAEAFLAADQDEEKPAAAGERVIVIRLDGGLVRDIKGIPAGYRVEVRDYDRDVVDEHDVYRIFNDDNGERYFLSTWHGEEGE